MKKIVFLVALANVSQSMEKKELDTFAYQDLLPELQEQVIQAIASAPSLEDCFKNYKNISLTSKKFYSQQTTHIFLDAVLKKFPEQQVRIARLGKNNFARQWLLAKKPHILFDTIPLSREQALEAYSMLIEGNIDQLSTWLNSGYDIAHSPVDLVGAAISTRSLAALKLLRNYGSDLSAQNQVEVGSVDALGISTIRRMNYVAYIKKLIDAPKLQATYKSNPTELELLNQMLAIFHDEGVYE